MTIGAAGLFGGSSIWGEKPGKTFRKQRASVLRGAALQAQGDALNRAEVAQGLRANLKGYDAALDQVSTTSRTARRESKERSQALGGQLTQRYGAGGQYGSTALAHAQMGLNASLTRELEGIDAGLAGLFGDISIGRGQAEFGGRAALGAIDAQSAGNQANAWYQIAGLQPQNEGIWKELLGTAVGAAASRVGG